MPVGRQVLGRRRFVQLLGWAGVVTMARGGPGIAQAAARTRGTAPPPAPSPATAPPPPVAAPPPATPEISAEARALAGIVGARHGLEAPAIESVARDIDGDLRAMTRLRETKLANADEPDFSFHA